MTVSSCSRDEDRSSGTETRKLYGSGKDISLPCTPHESAEPSWAEGRDMDAEKPLLETHDVQLEVRHPAVTQGTEEDKDEEEEEEEEDGVPYDRGWAWMVVLGLFVNFVLLSGYLKSSGVFFVELLKKFNAPATHTALLFAIRAGIFSICGLYVMNVFLGRFGSRKLAVAGGILMGLSAILSSLANQLTLLISLHSLLLAAGMAMLISPGEVLVGTYFKQHRSLALSLAKCGASIGNIAVPPLITFLLQEYGLSGTLLLYGGLCLNSVPAAMLFRPTSFFSRRHRRRRRPELAERGCGNDSCGDGGGGGAVGSGDVEALRSCEEGTSDVSMCPGGGGGGGGVVGKAGGSRPEAADDDGPLVGVRKARSDPQPSSLLKTRANESSGAKDVASDSRLQPGKDARRLPCFEHAVPKAAFTCSRHFDTLEGDVAALANSNPELAFLPSTSRSYRKRTFSEPPDKSCGARDNTEGKAQGSGLLEAISHSSVAKYMSVSSLDVVPASLPPSAASLHCRHKVRAANAGSLGSGLGEVHGNQTLESDEAEQGGASGRCRRAVKCLLQCPRKAVFMLDFSLFKSPLFRLLLLYTTTSPFVNITLDYLPALASENGVSESRAALLLSIIGGLDLACRLACGFIADLRILRVPTMIIISFVVLAVVTQFVRFMKSFEHLVVLAVLQGIFGGVANCLIPVLIIEFVGLENMGKGIGFCQLASGMSMAAIYPFLGYVRDTTGSYAIAYHLIGCGMLVSAGLLCCETPVRRLESKRQRDEHRDTTVPDQELVVASENNR